MFMADCYFLCVIYLCEWNDCQILFPVRFDTSLIEMLCPIFKLFLCYPFFRAAILSLYIVHCLLLHVAHMFPVMQSVLILFYRELLRCLYYLLCTSKKNVFYLLNIYYLFLKDMTDE